MSSKPPHEDLKLKDNLDYESNIKFVNRLELKDKTNSNKPNQTLDTLPTKPNLT